MKPNYKVLFYSLIVILFTIAMIWSIEYQSQKDEKKGYEAGYQAGAYYIIGQITTTAQVPYFDNSTGNLTIKYLDLNKKEWKRDILYIGGQKKD